jgi:hypothetical protein
MDSTTGNKTLHAETGGDSVKRMNFGVQRGKESLVKVRLHLARMTLQKPADTKIEANQQCIVEDVVPAEMNENRFGLVSSWA